MAGKKLGTIFVELGLDSTEFTKGEAKILQQAQSTSLKMEQNWRTLGSHSDQIFNAMRDNVINAQNAITNNVKSSAAERQRAEEVASAKIQSLNEQQFGKHTSLIDSLKKNWIAASIAIAAAMAAAVKAWNMAEVAADYYEQMQLLDGMVRRHGTTAQRLTEQIRQAGDGMISMSVAASTAMAGIAKGLTPEQLIKLAGAAVTLSDVMGVKVNDAFKMVAEALETGKVKSLKLAVGVIDLKDRYGEAADSMTEVQKQQALYNIIIERATEISRQQGEQTKSTADKMEAMRVTVQDLNLQVGTVFLRGVAGLVSSFYGWAAAITKVEAGYWRLLEVSAKTAAFFSFGELSKKAAEDALIYAQRATSASLSSLDYAEKANASFKVMTATTAELTKATGVQNAAIKEGGKINEETSAAKKKAQKEAEEAAKKHAEFMKKLNADLLNLKIKELEQEVGFIEAANKGIVEDEKKTNDRLKKLSDVLLKEMIADAEQEVEFIKAGNKGIIEDAERTKKKQEKYAHDVFDAQKRVGEDLAKLTNNEFKFKKDILDKEYAALKKLLGDSESLRKWYALRERELLQQKVLQSDDFFGGMAVAYEQDFLKQKKWGQQGADIWRSMFGRGGAIEGTLNTFFTDVFHGQLKSGMDYFNSFKDAVLNVFAKMIAEMTAQWIAFDLLGFKTGGGLGATGLIPAIGGLVGLATSEKAPAASIEGGGGEGVGGGLGTISTLASLYKTGSAAYTALTGGAAATTAVPIEVGASQAGAYFAAGEAAGAGGGAVAGAEAGAGGAGGTSVGMGAGVVGGIGFAAFVAAMIGMGIYDWATYKRTPNNPFSTAKEPESSLYSNQLFALSSGMPFKTHGDYASWKAVVVDQMIGKDLWDSMVTSPVYTPEWAYNRWIAEYGRPPNIDDVQFGSAWTWYKQLPEVQAGIATLASQIPQWLASYRYGANPDDYPMSNWYAKGGIITEHVIGRGMQTGQTYHIGEKGPEEVGPIGKRKPGISIQINAGTIIADEFSVNEFAERIGARLFKIRNKWSYAV